MADRNVLTAPVSVCFDPEIHPAPRGVTLWVVGPGGTGYKGHWYEGAIAWGYLPQIPESVKARQDQLQKEKQQRERIRDQQSNPELSEEQVR
ncbi:hypothetical protein H4CHR_02889 [Variovorax sp. PBS-H4]|uniref:hypothetical protein n=1 Tax=Variovorax sp. PBS-H4 TaxID=434008 RepID=UPI00131704C2|nr:hypothetical protein [Variovorax sp. PBS-H4]VTU31838.1 hypothetical protein H4CHR_02889 [Variovorax sp. PBS-H4]